MADQNPNLLSVNSLNRYDSSRTLSNRSNGSGRHAPPGVASWEYPGAGSLNVEYLSNDAQNPLISTNSSSHSTDSSNSIPAVQPLEVNFEFSQAGNVPISLESMPLLPAKKKRKSFWSFFPVGSDEAPTTPSGPEHHLLGEWPATAISGNDITSSCFYVSGVCAYYAGFWAPVTLFLVSVVLLYLFRTIYAEVIGALPVNGGTYTVLLNTTSKLVAGIAACLTLLSYTATAVVSASVAISYLNELASLSNALGTVILLVGFAVLNFFGLKDSARMALVIFGFHMAVMVILIIDTLRVAMTDNFSMLARNYHHRDAQLPDGTYPNSIGTALLYGFSSAMLGITGFETSSNYVEEQAPGVFPKTLRNMWICVALLNPTISILSLSVLPLPTVMGYPLDSHGRPQNNDLLKDMAPSEWLKKLVSIDAFLVLAGSVLTAYVGVTGLICRMSLDRCLPGFLLGQNKMFGSYHTIIIVFCAMCTSLYFIVDQNILLLSNIYALSFLCVMSLFALGNLILKYKRSRIRREHRAKVPIVIIAFAGVIIAIYGNAVLNKSVIKYFILYYGIALIIVAIMFLRVQLLKMFLKSLVRKGEDSGDDDEVVQHVPGIRGVLIRFAIEQMAKIKSQTMVFFIRERDIRLMNKAILYVRFNEQTENLKFVHVFKPIPAHSELDENLVRVDEMASDVEVLQRIFPKMKLDLLGVCTEMPFNGEVIRRISEKHNIPRHFMFISCPSEKFPQDIGKLGGVRLITG